MNEKIKELVEQAEIEFCDDRIPDTGYEFKSVTLTPEELEQFAELIIKKCAKIIDKVYDDAGPDRGCYDWSTWAGSEDILEYFGYEVEDERNL